MHHTWAKVDELTTWIDTYSTLPDDTESILRLVKVVEELGEIAQAIIGVYGQNPRKGHSHSREDVQAELCDLILTGMVALRTLTPEAEKTLRYHLDTTNAPELPQAGTLAWLLRLVHKTGTLAQAVLDGTAECRPDHAHTWDEVTTKLCDLILTGMAALRSLTPDAETVFGCHLDRVTQRVL